MRDFAEIQEMIRNQSFPEYLGKIDFISYFNENIRQKKGGGRDRMLPTKYEKQLKVEADIIKAKCIDGTYRFSPYNEKLILKGRNKYPRVISIPIVRDRLVLSILNSYLQLRFDIHRRTANAYIYDIQRFIENHKQKALYFFKTDFKSFFDSIDHNRLITILSEKLDEPSSVLIRSAITTPTCQPGAINVSPNKRGVPQGLSISSLLAEEYMKSFDEKMQKSTLDSNGIYIRYVDDVFIVSAIQKDWMNEINQCIESESLHLTLTEHKTKSGIYGEGETDYIGYSFTEHGVGVRKANIRIFSDRMASRCVKFVSQYKNSALRPLFVSSDDDFLKYSLFDINLLISGFRVKKHNYGWLPYFQQITDLRILYELDDMVRRLLKDTCLNGKVNSFVKTYHALRHKSGVPFVTDFDKVETPSQKYVILVKMGRISKDEGPSDAYIEHRYAELIESLTRSANKDMKGQY